MSDDRTTVATACKIMDEAGLTELFTGHISARQDGTILIPEHRHDQGRGLESIAPEYVIEVTPDGDPVTDGHGEQVTDEDLEPPSEFPLHSRILAARPEVNSVVHVHPEHATALSAAGDPVEPATLDATLFGGEVPIHDPGPALVHDDEQATAVADTLGEGAAVTLRGHGAITVGRSVAEATARMYILERAARLQSIAGTVGGVEPFEEFDEADGYLSEEDEGFFEEAFAFLRREYFDEDW